MTAVRAAGHGSHLTCIFMSLCAGACPGCNCLGYSCKPFISNDANLQAPASEKHYIICGPEFGIENVGKRAIIVRALYGGKSAGSDYWRHVRKDMEETTAGNRIST